jgi:hypothetical protein
VVVLLIQVNIKIAGDHYKTQSSDTSQQMEKVCIDLIRKASAAEKFSQVRALSKTTQQLSRRAIRRANKELSEDEIDLIFVSHHYGEKLAARLKKYLSKIKNEIT